MFEAVPLTTPAREYAVPLDIRTPPQERASRRRKKLKADESKAAEPKTTMRERDTVEREVAKPKEPIKELKIPAVPTAMRNDEEEFARMYESLSIGNHNVRTKREELGKFPFSTKTTTEGLELIRDSEENDETYSGFVYFSL
eukprot:TRINITY_DN2414_c0_g1_i13.p3 TRINITY_DN2414_c0_g1~~TRINITY_DN2414_c0_g1_i13.p3  ORF type:complete len:142 (-),score=50.85 TRINITY_DN2414_c0_g1_i13:765-1190(-)